MLIYVVKHYEQKMQTTSPSKISHPCWHQNSLLVRNPSLEKNFEETLACWCSGHINLQILYYANSHVLNAISESERHTFSLVSFFLTNHHKKVFAEIIRILKINYSRPHIPSVYRKFKLKHTLISSLNQPIDQFMWPPREAMIVTMFT